MLLPKLFVLTEDLLFLVECRDLNGTLRTQVLLVASDELIEQLHVALDHLMVALLKTDTLFSRALLQNAKPLTFHENFFSYIFLVPLARSAASFFFCIASSFLINWILLPLDLAWDHRIAACPEWALLFAYPEYFAICLRMCWLLDATDTHYARWVCSLVPWSRA